MKKKNVFSELNNAGLGLGKLSISTAVGAGIAAQAPAGTPSLTGGFNTLAGFSGIAVTAVGGKAVLSSMKYKKKKYY